MVLRFTTAVLFVCALLWIAPAESQAPKVARVAIVWPVGFADAPVEPLLDRLRHLGWEEGRNLVLERRTAEGKAERLPTLMAEVLTKKVDVIATVSTPGAIAAKNATNTIPIVAGAMGDPLRAGLAASLSRPGGNLTGLSYGFSDGFAGKWIELLRDCVPQLKSVAVLYNPSNPWSVQQRKNQEASAASLGLRVQFLEITAAESLNDTLAKARRNAQGLIVVADPLTYQLRLEIASLAIRQGMPMMASMLEFADAGGLLSYGVDSAVAMRRMAELIDRILRGAKPAEIPIEQPSELSLAVNLKTAAALGLTVPPSVLQRADRVIK